MPSVGGLLPSALDLQGNVARRAGGCVMLASAEPDSPRDEVPSMLDGDRLVGRGRARL